MRIKKCTALLLVIPLVFVLLGFSFSGVTVMVDTEKNRVYEYVSADDLLNSFATDIDSAKNEYKDGYYIIFGKIESISRKGDSVNVYGSTVTSNYVICSVPKSLRSVALSYNTGDGIAVFGRVSVDPIDKDIHIEVERIIDAPSAVKSGMYYLLNGASIDRNSMNHRTLHGGTVSYHIPSAWKGVEHSIKEEGIGTIEGYQYVLNQLPGSIDSVPESFFVCYFDNATMLENADDKKETELIEKAIINNISGEGIGNDARTRDVTTYYDTKYNYFLCSYTDVLDIGNNGYHVEYIFQKNGSDGLVMYLYVYKDAKHLSDVMFVTRFLEISSQ